MHQPTNSIKIRFLFFFLGVCVLYPLSVMAITYQPGETLDPACLPTDAECLVATSTHPVFTVFHNALFGATATSSFNASGVLTLASALGTESGGTGAASFGQGWLFSSGSDPLSASTSPTVNYIVATSTTATSTFSGGVATGGLSSSHGLTLSTITSCNNLGTDSAGTVHCQLGQQSLDVRKSADESLTENAVLQDDDELFFAIGANETWVFQFNLLHTTHSGPDMQLAVTAPSGATCDYAAGSIEIAKGTGSATCGEAVALTSGNSTANAPLYLYGAIVNGSTAGTVRLQWAQNSSNSNPTTIHRGSILSAFRVSGGADVAEVYYSRDLSLVPGTVVAPDATLPNGVRRAQKGDDALGIISTKPGLVMGDLTEAYEGMPVMVALIGRVPARVTVQNGPIAVGDYLTSSDIPGVAMKATQSGMVMGQALSRFDGGSDSDVGMVSMFIKNQYHQSPSESARVETIDIVRSEMPANALTAISDRVLSGVKVVTDFVSARVTAVRGYFDELFAKKVHTDELCLKKSDGGEVCINGDQLQVVVRAQ